jgi:hypothetical protein
MGSRNLADVFGERPGFFRRWCPADRFRALMNDAMVAAYRSHVRTFSFQSFHSEVISRSK